MRIRWVKVWVDAMASLTERFRDEEGCVDFNALGREEYAFRHALVTGDLSRSERARELYDATINEITSRSEAGRKGAEARWSKNKADGDIREDSQDIATSGNGSVTESGTSANIYGDAHRREAGEVVDSRESGAAAPTTVSRNMRRVPQNEAPAHGFSGGRTAQGTMSRSPEAAAQSGKAYDQEAPKTRDTRDDYRGRYAPPSCSPEDGNPAETAPSHGGSVASLEARQGQALESRHGAGEVTPESVSAPSPALPAKHPHGEFGNVMLTTDEYIKLFEKCQDADSLITELDQYIESQGKTKKYKSHYATLLNWSRRKAQEAKPKQGYMTSDDISKKNYDESKARLEAMFSKGRKTA